jgi:hypothetical protein
MRPKISATLSQRELDASASATFAVVLDTAVHRVLSATPSGLGEILKFALPRNDRTPAGVVRQGIV